jgi:hypothetical protein
MASKVGWEILTPDVSLIEFAVKHNLDVQSLRIDHDVAILPNDGMLSETPKQHLFAPSSKELLFVLRESGVNASLYEDGRPRRELVLKSATVVLPLFLYYAGAAAYGVALGVLSNWISNKFLKNRQAEIPTIRYESADLRPDGSVRVRRIEGPADQVGELLLQESKALAGEVAANLATTQPQIQANPEWTSDQRTKRKKGSRKHKR